MVHEAWLSADWGGICCLAVNDPPHAAQKKHILSQTENKIKMTESPFPKVVCHALYLRSIVFCKRYCPCMQNRS